MPHSFFERHEDLLRQATAAIAQRGHWSPYPDVPSGKIYGETAHADGKAAFEARLSKPFAGPHSPPTTAGG